MSDTPPTDREADDAAHAGREPRQGPPPSIDDAFREISDAGREGLSAALDTGRALRGLLIADFALARSALGRALLWVSVAIIFGASSWLLLMAALIALLQGVLGWSWLASMSAAAGLSLVVTAIGVWQALRYFEYTRLSATRRQLRRLGLGHDDDDDREIESHKTEAR
ncbi:phage holin family protein [Lysobacter sp. TAB13]|uniref:phage holin family protein n=1 Tax=Lysobacter sp. TAB13 TaxID=3233065 RepID=UPI003F9513A3